MEKEIIAEIRENYVIEQVENGWVGDTKEAYASAGYPKKNKYANPYDLAVYSTRAEAEFAVEKEIHKLASEIAQAKGE